MLLSFDEVLLRWSKRYHAKPSVDEKSRELLPCFLGQRLLKWNLSLLDTGSGLMEVTVTDAPTFVLVHGWAGSAESWRPVAEVLADRTGADPVLARLPCSPGAAEGREPTISSSADLVGELLSATAGPAVLVGHSMGAQVTLLAHSRSPQLVLGEVVIDPAYGAPTSTRDEMSDWAARIESIGHAAVEEFFGDAVGSSLDPALAERIRADMRATPASAIASYLRSEYTDADALGLMDATIRAVSARQRPVLAIHSREDAARREESLPRPAGSRVQHWPGFGHFLHLQDPERFADSLLAFAVSARSSGQLTRG